MIARYSVPSVLIAAALLLVTACSGGSQTGTAEAQPIAYAKEDGRLTTQLSLDPALRAYPELRARLYADGMTVIREFEAETHDARAEEGGELSHGMNIMVEWGAPVETTRLVGVEGSIWAYTGGAHGNAGYHAMLWNRMTRRPVAPAALFRTDADLTILDRALCDATNVAKADRTDDQAGDPVPYLGEQGDSYWACPAALETPFSFAPGSVAGKAGGLVFVIGPYIVGPYSEGSYFIVVPATAFSALLSPEWRDQFGGSPTQEFLDTLRAEPAP